MSNLREHILALSFDKSSVTPLSIRSRQSMGGYFLIISRNMLMATEQGYINVTAALVNKELVVPCMNIALNVQPSISLSHSPPDIDNKESLFFYSTQSKIEVRKL